MGNKNAGQRIQIGRTVMTLPDMAAGDLGVRVDRRAKQLEQERAKDALIAEQAAEIERFKFDNNLGAIALDVIKDMKLRPLDAEKLGNRLNAAVDRHVKAGKSLTSFDYLSVISDFRARLGQALPPAPKLGKSLENNLRPPAQEGHTHPNDLASVAAQQEQDRERGHATRHDDQKESQRLRDRTFALGLTPGDMPSLGTGRPY